MATEALGWAMIAVTTLIWLNKKNDIPKAELMINSLSTETEVDVSRWKHNGQQPVFHKEGNQMAFDDEQVKQLVLAF